MYFCCSAPSLQNANVDLPVSPASATRRLKAVVRKMDPCLANSGADAMLASGDRSAGFSNTMVVRAGERRAAMASLTVRSRSSFEFLSSRWCLGSIWLSGRPSGLSKSRMIGGPESPPASELASKKRAMDDVLHGNAIMSAPMSPASALARRAAKSSSLSRSCNQPPPFSPSLSICTTVFQPAARTAAARPSARAYGPEKRLRKSCLVVGPSNVAGAETFDPVVSEPTSSRAAGGADAA